MKLVGTVHTDINGPKRLEKLLETERPRVISVECSSLFLAEDLASSFEQVRAAPGFLLNMLPSVGQRLYREIFSVYGYELIVANNYAKQNGARIHLVDGPGGIHFLEVHNFRTQVFQLCSAELKNLAIDAGKATYNQLKSGYIKTIDDIYSNPKLLEEIMDRGITTHEGPAAQPANEKSMMKREQRREKYLARNLKRFVPDVHIGGVAHISEGFFPYEGFLPLYRLLGALNPQTLKLCDVKPELKKG